jgi:hypothetical protein
MAFSGIDHSLNFGLQNYFIVASDETGVTYNYYGYMDKKGAILILRNNKTSTELRYYVAVGTFTTIWAGITGYTYLLPNQLEDVKI